MSEKNGLYHAFNLPLQVWPSEDGSSCEVLNYMPRKHGVRMAELSDLMGEQSREDFFNKAADGLENLAKLMRRAAVDPVFTVYYHDADPNDKD